MIGDSRFGRNRFVWDAFKNVINSSWIAVGLVSLVANPVREELAGNGVVDV